MKLTIFERDDGITHIALDGRLDTTGTEEIADEFQDVTVGRSQSAIVDLSGIQFLASRGIGMLFATGKRLKQDGRKMVLVNPVGMVHTVLKTAKVTMVTPIAATFEQALEAVGGNLHGERSASEPAATEHAAGTESTAPTAVREGTLKVTVENNTSELPRLNAALAEFLEAHGAPYRATYAVNLAIDELVVNVMRYAYVDDDPHDIDVELSIEGEQVVLRVVDDGRPFDPRRGPSLDLHSENRDAGGLGLILVLDIVDVLDYRRVDEKNCVEVRVHLFHEDDMDIPSQGE